MKQLRIDLEPRVANFDYDAFLEGLYKVLDLMGIDVNTPITMALEYIDDIDLHKEKYKYIHELCPCCGLENMLENEFEWQICTGCGYHMKPCSICPTNYDNCQNCPLEKNTTTCYTETCHYNEGCLCMYKVWGDDGTKQDCEGLINGMRWHIDE